MFLRKIIRGGANKSFGIEVADLSGVNKKITDRARAILKELENKDRSKSMTSTSVALEKNEKSRQKQSEVERILSDIDVNNLSPMQAFNLLVDLREKVKENE